MKILIVDDNSADRDLVITNIKKTKGKQKITIDESACLKDALEKVNMNNYDVIILDLKLPETDGLDTVKAMKEELEKIQKNIPIIILTGNENYDIGRKAWTMGVKDFLNKDDYEKEDIKRALKFTKIKKRSLLKK